MMTRILSSLLFARFATFNFSLFFLGGGGGERERKKENGDDDQDQQFLISRDGRPDITVMVDRALNSIIHVFTFRLFVLF